MNTLATRGKRRQLQRALQSIQITEPAQRVKAHTEVCEPIESAAVVLQRPTGKEDRGMRALRRLHRYKQGEQQQEETLAKHRSLEVGRRQLRRKSEQRLHPALARQHASLEKSPYLPLHLRKLNDSGLPRELRDSKQIRETRKISIPKKQVTETGQDCKQAARVAMRKGDYKTALYHLQRSGSSSSDLQALQMGGVCLMNLREFQEAVVRLSRVLLLDADYNKKVYIWVALCENQLNHAERCLHYINQCTTRFPDYYEGFYFKGKLLYKQQLYPQAVDFLLQAAALNPRKLQIKLLVAECYALQGNVDQALLYYQRYLPSPTPIPIPPSLAKHTLRYATLLISNGKAEEGVALLQKLLMDTQGTQGMEGERVQTSAQLCLAYFRNRNHELCAMRGEEVISRGSPSLALPAIRAILSSKVIQHDYYGAIYFLRRLTPQQIGGPELRPCVQFLQGVAFLMKKRSEEGLKKLDQVGKLLHGVLDEFNMQIHQNYRLFIVYAHFLEGRYGRCLREAAAQREVGVQPYWEGTLGYIECICTAMLSYNDQDYSQCEKQLRECIHAHPQRAQACLYLAVLLMQMATKETEAAARQEMRQLLAVCTDRFGGSSSNYAAYIFYYRGVASAWGGEWAAAAGQLQTAIDKSEDNFFNFYYLRGLALANLQNYKQAISDASLALSIAELPCAYLLRARCLQIQGNPGQAFADLQSFIALRPEDKQVHKFAGHLLFQNGAFQDALQAYGQGDVTTDDLEVFLTRSKTYFLLGNFLRASEDMDQAARLQSQAPDLRFDQRVMQWLSQLLSRYIKNQCEDDYQFDPVSLGQALTSLRAIYHAGADCLPKYGKIFKLPQYLTLAASCHFYLADYAAAMDCLIQAIELKQAALDQVGDGEEFEQEEAEKLVFINQMYYNLALCCCLTQDYPNAERYLRKCTISPQLHNYDIYLQLLDQIAGRQPVDENVTYLDLFSLRNKLSRYFPKVAAPFLSSAAETPICRPLKLCIPYPKVEPPEITPSFDKELLKVDLNQLERRADAPWIYREKDSIKFTERIQVFSRFQLEKSQVGERRGLGSSVSGGSSQVLPANLREQLRLDARLQQRLNKLIGKEK